MVTTTISKVLEPLVNESLDEYLYRATDSKETRYKLLKLVQEELTKCTQTTLKRELQHMEKILIGAGKTHFLANDIDGNHYWGEVVYSRAARYDLPSCFKNDKESK